MLIDINATRRHQAPEFVLKTFYGQLQHLYLVRFEEANRVLGLDHPTTVIMAAIRNCKVDDKVEVPGLDLHFYSQMGAMNVVDVTALQCLVGRVPDGKDSWAIIDRSGSLARAMYLDD
jgi:hypothetical protein